MEAMTAVQARQFMDAYNATVRTLDRTSKAKLAEIERRELADRGITRLYGTMSREDLLKSIVDMRFPSERWQLANHTLYHNTGDNWSACQYC